MRQFVVWLAPEAGIFHRFTGQGPIDEDGLPLLAGDSPRLVVQRYDSPDRHGLLRKKREFYQSVKLSAMARELITSWAEYQTAIDRLLAIACHHVSVYDEDLTTLKLDSAPRLDHLKRLLSSQHGHVLRIALRNGAPLRDRHPTLQNLLTTYSHVAQAQETPEQIAHLRDSMIIIDGKHALIRFERDMPRSKLLIDEIDELRPYLNRFEEIWQLGGERISNSVAGL